MSYLEQFLENNSCTAPYRPSPKQSKLDEQDAGHCWRNKDELLSDVLLLTPTHERASVSQPTRTCLHQLYADTECNLEDLPREMDDRNRERERERETDRQTDRQTYHIYPTPPLGQDMTQSLFFSGV